MHDFIIKDPWQELRLPVAPPAFEVDNGIKIETVNIHNVGDVIFGTNGTLGSIVIDSFFPAQNYYFAHQTGENPYSYVDWFVIRSYNKTECRLIVTGTPINIPVIIENIKYSEKDGTGDVYYLLTLRQTRELSARVTNNSSNSITQENQRADEVLQNETAVENYTIKPGDNLSTICRIKYGNSNLWPKLQKYNGLSSTVIISGNTLRLPPISELGG